MKTFQSQKNYPKGATSLLIVVAVSLILITIVVGITTLSIRQSRQALNTDLSNRALAAAKSATQDAALAALNDPQINYPNCNGSGARNSVGTVSSAEAVKFTRPVVSADTGNQTEIVCRTLVSTAPSISGQLKKDEDTQILLTLDSVARIGIVWNKEGVDSVNPGYSGTIYPASSGYSNAAGLELSFVYWPKSGVNAPPGIKTFYVMPGNSDQSDLSSHRINGNSIVTSNCSSSLVDEYNCYLILDTNNPNTINNLGINPSVFNIAMRITARYAQATYQALFYKTTSEYVGNPPTANVQNTKAVIDVTAKVGNLYRRVQAEQPIGNLSFLDSVLYSGGSICKNLVVYDDHTSSPSVGDGKNNCGGIND
ncbi:MAG: hypothetical protein U0516_04380 [Candidatus Saccharibacteria bacterium]